MVSKENLVRELPLSEQKTINLNREQAFALGHPVRWKILQLLQTQILHADEIARKLGIKTKTITGIRHHIEILNAAGVIEIAKLTRHRGGMFQYYRPIIIIEGMQQ